MRGFLCAQEARTNKASLRRHDPDQVRRVFLSFPATPENTPASCPPLKHEASACASRANAIAPLGISKNPVIPVKVGMTGKTVSRYAELPRTAGFSTRQRFDQRCTRQQTSRLQPKPSVKAEARRWLGGMSVFSVQRRLSGRPLSNGETKMSHLSKKCLAFRFLWGCLVVMATIALPGRAWAQNELFVSNTGGNSVTVYSRTANGNIAPTRTLSGAATGLAHPTGIVADTVNSELVVGNNFGQSVTVFGVSASGNTAPTRTLSGTATGIAFPAGVAVDTANNELFVANNGGASVTVYARTANGNASPLRTLSGASTGLFAPAGIALDTVNNELFVANNGDGTIRVFGRTASGNTAPTRILNVPSSSPFQISGVFVDNVNNELFVTNNGTYSVSVFSRTASGSTAPLRTVSGAATGFDNPFSVVVDSVNNELLVVNTGQNTGVASVTVYPRSASGNLAPIRALAGAATNLSLPTYLAVTTGTAPPRPLPPTLTKAFGAGSVIVNTPTTLTLSLANPNPSATLTGIAFTDPFPSGLVVATPNGLTTTCGGAIITATAGSSAVSLSGETFVVGASCAFTVNVVPTAVGPYTNTTGAITSNESGAGATASASFIAVAATPPPSPMQPAPTLQGWALWLLGATLLVVGGGVVVCSLGHD